MPKTLSEIRIVLSSDSELTENVPTFIYRGLTGREWKRAALMHDSLNGDMSVNESLESIYSTCAIGLKGWENMTNPVTDEPLPFNVADLDLCIGPLEAAELLRLRLSEEKVSTDDKKKLESQPASKED